MYTTKYFFAGKMRLSFESGWQSDEDSTGDFGAARTQRPDYGVNFWENTLGFPQWDAPGGIAGDDIYRLYLANVEYGGTRHLFAALVEVQNRADLVSFLPTAERLIGTLRVPAKPA